MSEVQAVDKAIELSERIAVLTKAALDGFRRDSTGDLMLNSADAEVAMFTIVDLVREQKRILTAIPESS